MLTSPAACSHCSGHTRRFTAAPRQPDSPADGGATTVKNLALSRQPLVQTARAGPSMRIGRNGLRLANRMERRRDYGA